MSDPSTLTKDELMLKQTFYPIGSEFGQCLSDYPLHRVILKKVSFGILRIILVSMEEKILA